MLLARGNQLRNLDKQIGVLSNFNFLKRLDLSDNAVADEPDYLLRVIYNLPQAPHGFETKLVILACEILCTIRSPLFKRICGEVVFHASQW